MSKKFLLNPKSTSVLHPDEWNSRFWVGKIPDYKPKSALSTQNLKGSRANNLPKIRSAHTQPKSGLHSKLETESGYNHLETEYTLKTEPFSDQVPGVIQDKSSQKKMKTEFSYQNKTNETSKLSNFNISSQKLMNKNKSPSLRPPETVKKRILVNCEPAHQLKTSNKSLNQDLPKISLQKPSSSLKFVNRDSVFDINPSEILEIDSDSSGSDHEYFLNIAQEIFYSFIGDSITYFCQLTANEAINEAILAYLTLSSSKILSSYINEALDSIVPALSVAWYEESKEQEPSDLRDLIADLVKDEEICRIVCDVNLHIIASEITEEYTLMIPLESLIEESIYELEQSNKERVVKVLELLIDTIVEEEWVEVLAEDVINSMRIEKIWTLFPPKLQKEVSKMQEGKIVGKLVEEVYFGILNDIVAGFWVNSVCEACISGVETNDYESEMPIPKFTSKKTT